MSVVISPVGLSGAPVANQLSALVTIREKLCKAICVDNNTQPNAIVSYTAGVPTLNDTTVFIPIVASIQILSPSPGCCQAIPQMFTERFTVAFQGRTTLPSSVTVESVGMSQGISCVKNGKAFGYTINDSIQVTIGAASSAS